MHHTQPNRRQTLLALIGTALLPACGGGTDVAGISSGGTGSFTTGSITGLGSVIVNGIRYDDSEASIRINGRTATPATLQLGMVVRIQGGAVTAPAMPGALATSKASTIVCGSEWKGLVSAVNTTATPPQFTLLDQTVRVLATTVFDGGALGTLSGQSVEVYGFIDPTDNSLTATRVEIRSDLDSYRLSGVVTDLNAGAKTFRLGSAVIAYSSAPAMQNGLLVRVELQTLPNGSGQWVATEVRVEDFSSELDDDDDAELEGSITTLTSPTRFSVNGIPVNAAGVPNLPALSLGQRVEVKGRVRDGFVVATEVDIEDEDEIEAQEYEFHGAVSGIDTDAKTFVVRGYTLHYDNTTRFALHGATWDAHLNVHIEAKARLQANGLLLATQVETDH